MVFSKTSFVSPLRRPEIYVPGLALLPAMLIYFAVQGWHMANRKALQQMPPVSTYYDEVKTKLQNGDLVFRQGYGFFTRLVLWMDPGAVYSHVGIVVKQGNDFYIVHALSEEALQQSSRVTKVPLEHFIKPENARSFAFARVQTTEKLRKLAAKHACTYYRNFSTYDLAFDLGSPDALYCSELIWRAYMKVGVDLMNNNFDKLWILGGGKLIKPESLLESRYTMLLKSYPE